MILERGLKTKLPVEMMERSYLDLGEGNYQNSVGVLVQKILCKKSHKLDETEL